jgi:hypothetical protein
VTSAGNVLRDCWGIGVVTALPVPVEMPLHREVSPFLLRTQVKHAGFTEAEVVALP